MGQCELLAAVMLIYCYNPNSAPPPASAFLTRLVTETWALRSERKDAAGWDLRECHVSRALSRRHVTTVTQGHTPCKHLIPGHSTVKVSHPLFISGALFSDAESLRGLTSLDVTRSDGTWSHTERTTWTPSHNIPEIGQKFKPSQTQLDARDLCFLESAVGVSYMMSFV